MLDLAELNQNINETMEHRISKSSSRAYRSSYCRFLSFLVQHYPSHCSDAFLQELGPLPSNQEEIVHLVKQKLRKDIKPVRFHTLRATHFLQWLQTLKKQDNSKLSFSGYATHRSGFVNLFSVYDEIIPADISRTLTKYFAGLKRELALEQQDGNGAIKQGKDPMTFELYQFLANRMLCSAEKDMAFAHCYLVTAWNLMCRAGNAFRIRYSHMEWRNDSLVIYFAHQKNDQTGERPRDPRHVFANPFCPAVCPILGLGIWWASFGFNGDGLLFPGNAQYARFQSIFSRMLEKDESTKEKLQVLGVNPKELGTHSLRKGSSSYCSSGSTAGPPPTAVHLRAGWSLGGVQNTYLRYQGAGDMFVGRTTAGLPIETAGFATLPPHFPDADEMVSDAVKMVFPKIPDNLRYVGEFCLASLVYHSNFLKKIMRETSALLTSPLFMKTEPLDSLKKRVKCCRWYRGCRLTTTGIPPYVVIMATIQDAGEKIPQVVHAAVSEAVKDIRESGGISSVTMEKLLDQKFDRAFQEFLNKIGWKPTDETDSTSEEQTESEMPKSKWFFRHGIFFHTPENF